VTVSILDSQGRLVRRYISAEHGASADPAKDSFAPVWAQAPAAPSAKPGMQRFVWDLHYPPPDAGIRAPPGTYTVQLGVMGREYNQPLIVQPDPHAQASQTDYIQQFQLAQKVDSAEFRASQMVDRAVKLLDALEAGAPRSGAAHAQLAKLMAEARNISGAQTHPERLKELTGMPPDRTDSLRALAFDLSNLEEAIESGDGAPSPDALTAYAMLSRKLDVTSSQWQRLERVEVPRLNARLRAQGDKPIEYEAR
jgi:hypothetical protein